MHLQFETLFAHTLTNMHDYYFYYAMCMQQYWSRDFTASCLDCRCFQHLKFTEKLTPPKHNLMQRSDISSMVVHVRGLALILLLLIYSGMHALHKIIIYVCQYMIPNPILCCKCSCQHSLHGVRSADDTYLLMVNP